MLAALTFGKGRSTLHRCLLLLGCMLVFSAAPAARAEPIPSLIPGGKPVEVPKELVPWVPWVSQGITEGLCPKIGEQEICQWPASLALEIRTDGARFTFEVHLEAEGWVSLPGSAIHWPESVEVDAKPAPVLSKELGPVVRLPRGAHRIMGAFAWSKAPETLQVPASVAVVRLLVGGRVVEFPRREDNGALWLQAGTATDEDASDRVEIEVFRRVDDGVPLGITTQLDLHVSGRARELRLVGSTLPGSRPLSIESATPARLDPNGDLRLQVSAGDHRVVLKGVFPRPPERIQLPPQSPPWPPSEVWVFVANNAVRQVEVGGAPAIDAAQTNLPDDWKRHQALLVSKEKGLTFETKRRGEPEPPPNQLQIVRQLLLDLDGQGYTVQDQISGELSRSFRLDLAGAALGHVAEKGRDLLVTQGPDGKTGVELRQKKVALTAEWRLNQRSRELPAVGWNADLGSLRTTLHLPPGWEVLHVSGVDSARDTWWTQWSLWSFFYVLLVTIAVTRLFGPAVGGGAFVTLVITHGRNEGLMAFWAILLVLLALLRLVPTGWFRQCLRIVWFSAVVVFAIACIRFSVGEVRAAFFPVTHPPASMPGYPGMLRAQDWSAEAPSEVVASAPMPLTAESADKSAGSSAAGASRRSVLKGKLASRLSSDYEEVPAALDADTVVQTGTGMPRWAWERVDLSWSGPVQSTQRLRLYLLNPAWNRLLGCLRVLGVICLGVFLVRRTAYGRTPPSSMPRFGRQTSPVTGALALLSVALVPSVARAEPRSDVLDELKARLVRGPDCEGCLEVESLEFQLARRTLETTARVHAGRVTDYRVPGPVRSWVPQRVLVDGKPATAMILGADGFLHVRLSDGSHRVQALGPVSGSEIVISPGSPPHRVVVSTEGWSVDGLRDGRVENSVRFMASEKPAPGAAETDGASEHRHQLPPWLEITRSLEMGVSWKVTTEVSRKSPLGEPISLRYPLLAGEEVTTGHAIVEGQELVVALGRDDQAVSYQSVIKPSAEIQLTAAIDRPWTEQWKVRCSALWHCEFANLEPIARADEAGYAPRFSPWPGEKLLVTVTRPLAAPGESRTIERAEATVTPGQRLLSGVLELTIKVSKAYSQPVKLDPGSTVQQLTINGHEEPIRMNGTTVELQLQPGNQEVKLTWHEPRPQAVWFSTPHIDLLDKAVNAKVRVRLPDDRWLLFTWGPSWGPKVLLWSYLLMLVGAAWILVRIPKNPLKLWQWVVLGIGLTQIPIAITLMIAAWFFSMSWRGRVIVERVWIKRWMQIGLAGYTLFFLGSLCGAVYDGLVSNPDMLIAGSPPDGGLALTWYVDRIHGALPQATVISLPVVVFRLLNLLWALWLASSLLTWLKWGWGEYGKGGLWARKAVPVPPAPPPAAAPLAAPPADQSVRETPS